MIDEQAGQSTPAPKPDKITAPWDDRTVAALNAFQSGGYLHPFTCPREHFTSGEVKLFATNEGWVCTCAPACGYTQDWAHAVMADPKARASLHPALSVSPSGENTTPVGAEGQDDSSTAQGASLPLSDVPSCVTDAIEFVLVRFVEGTQSRDAVRAILIEAFRESLPDSETERPRRCPALVPEGDLVTEGRQCQQYEGHPHDHIWYGDNGIAYSAWRVTS